MWWLKKTIKILKFLLNVGSVTIIMLIIMLDEEIIVISPEWLEALEALEYRSCPQRDCNINLKLNYKSPVVF